MSRRRSSSCTEELANPLSTSYQRASQDSSFTQAGRHVSNGLTQIPDASDSPGGAEAHSNHHAVSIASSPPRTRTESTPDKPHGRRRTSVARRACFAAAHETIACEQALVFGSVLRLAAMVPLDTLFLRI